MLTISSGIALGNRVLKNLALLAAVGAALSMATAASAAASPAAAAYADGYPAWAAAIAPAYTSHVTSKGGRSDDTYETYQIYTADPYETVLAWYKAHTQTTWPDRHKDQTVGKFGAVHITLQTVQISSNPSRTAIGFVKKR